jgi:hypothetical protein
VIPIAFTTLAIVFACWVGSACVNHGCVSRNCFTPVSSVTHAFWSVVAILVFLKSIYHGCSFSLAIAAAPKTSHGSVACVVVSTLGVVGVICDVGQILVNGQPTTGTTGELLGETVVFCPVFPVVVVVNGAQVKGLVVPVEGILLAVVRLPDITFHATGCVVVIHRLLALLATVQAFIHCFAAWLTIALYDA